MENRRHFFAALVVSSSASFLLCGYEFVRSASNTLFKAAYGTQSLPTIMALVPFSVLLVLYLYGRALSRLGPRRTLWWSTIVSGAVLFGCWALIDRGARIGTAVLYLFREAYVVLLIEQYWSFLNSTLSEKSAKKLNGPITGWASLGAIAGGFLVHALSQPLGTNNLLLFAVALVFPGAVLSDLAYRRCGEPAREREAKHEKGLALGLFRESGLLRLLMALIIVTQVVSTFVGLSFQGLLQEAIPDADAQTAYSGRFFGILNAVAAALQFIAAPILLRATSASFVHLLIPFVHLATLTAVVLHPGIETAAVAYLLFKSFDYSIFRAAKEIFYIPLSFDSRYRAKEVIDVFGYRFGKGATSLGIAALQRAGVVFERIYAPLALIAVGAWIVIVSGLTRKTREERRGPLRHFDVEPIGAQ